MSTLLQDIRYGARMLARGPMIALVAVFTLALGIGANTAIFSVIRAVLLDQLPFGEPERLVRIWESRLDRGWTRASFTRANFWDLRARNRTFDGIEAYRPSSMTLEWPSSAPARRV